MCHHPTSNPIHVHIKKAFSLGIVLTLVSGCKTSDWFPVPDCGVIKDLDLKGVVQTINGTPIADATISIRSAHELSCPNSVSIDDIVLTSDEEGQFFYTIAYIAADDILEVTATAEGYKDYINDYVTFASFRDVFTVVMW